MIATKFGKVDMLGLDAELDWWVADGSVSVTLPERLPVYPVHTLRLWPVLLDSGRVESVT